MISDLQFRTVLWMLVVLGVLMYVVIPAYPETAYDDYHRLGADTWYAIQPPQWLLDRARTPSR